MYQFLKVFGAILVSSMGLQQKSFCPLYILSIYLPSVYFNYLLIIYQSVYMSIYFLSISLFAYLTN